jgi:hypothetical protein
MSPTASPSEPVCDTPVSDWINAVWSFPPSLPEQTDGKTESSNKGRHQTLLGRDVSFGAVKLAAPVIPIR